MPKLKTSFTNTKGQKVKVYTDGSKTYNGVSPSKDIVKATGGGPVETTNTTETSRFSRIKTNGSENTARNILHDVSPYNEKDRRNEMLKNMSGHIQAIDSVYDRKVADERKLGEKDLARSNTISAMTGMMGAPEASTRAGNADRRTEDRVAIRNEERALALSGIYQQIDQNIAKEKEAHLQTQRENASRILEETAKNAKTALNSMASQGIGWEKARSIDPDAFDETIRLSGADPFEMQILYENAMPKEQQPKAIFEGFRGDNFVRILQNPDGSIATMTKTASELGIPKDIDVATITLGDGVYWYDKNSPLGEDGRPNLVRLGADPVAYRQAQKSAKVTKTADIPTWEEFIAGKEQEARQTLTPKTRETFRDEYEQLVNSLDDTVDPTKNYTATNIPNKTKNNLVADITQNGGTLEQLYSAYPDVSTSYINSLFNSLKKKTETEVDGEVDLNTWLNK